MDHSPIKPADSNGVGLSICKSICKQLGGDINVVSKLGYGTTFSFEVIVKTKESTKIGRGGKKINLAATRSLDIILEEVIGDFSENSSIELEYQEEEN